MRRVGAVPSATSRRRFLQASLAAGVALMLPQRQTTAQSISRPRVFIIGAGFAGLSCAYQLHRAGADVLVLEARNRLCGRVLTLGNVIPGQLIEGGAELVGGNHPTWMAYAKEFGLTMRDVSDDDDLASPLLINGKSYANQAANRLFAEMDKALALMNSDARFINRDRPWLTADAARLDQRSLADVASHWSVEPDVRAAALALLANDSATNPSEASYLGILSTIAGAALRPFGQNPRSIAVLREIKLLLLNSLLLSVVTALPCGRPLSEFLCNTMAFFLPLLTASSSVAIWWCSRRLHPLGHKWRSSLNWLLN